MIQTNDILQWVADGIFWLSIAIVIAALCYIAGYESKNDDHDHAP